MNLLALTKVLLVLAISLLFSLGMITLKHYVEGGGLVVVLIIIALMGCRMMYTAFKMEQGAQK